MKKKLRGWGISLLPVLCMAFGFALGCTGCGGTGTGAASMFLRKTEGTVVVADAGGAEVVPAENLGLYSGYTVGTKEESYAWIDLDKVKLTKLDENSAAEITKDGKNLSINVTSGSMFFNVTEPLKDDETMEISTSSLMVGIRGTCGWMAQRSVGLLEGTVTVTAGEESVTINAGEQAVLTQDGALEVRALTFESIPAFVAQELLDDDALHQAVFEASGLRVPITYEELADSIGDVVYFEEFDFEADGSPELLVIRDDISYGAFGILIYRMRPDGPELLMSGFPMSPDFVGGEPTRYACLLVERNGRLYVCCQRDGVYIYTYRHDPPVAGTFCDTYYGSVVGQNGGYGDWGQTDRFSSALSRNEIVSPPYEGLWPLTVHDHNEKGFVGNSTEQILTDEEKQAYLSKYTFVRELYAKNVTS